MTRKSFSPRISRNPRGVRGASYEGFAACLGGGGIGILLLNVISSPNYKPMMSARCRDQVRVDWQGGQSGW